MSATEPKPYESAADHLEDELRLVALLLARVTHRGRAEGWVRGTNVEAEQDLDAALLATAARLGDRLRLSWEAGRPPPLDVLRRRLALSATEYRVLVLLAGHDLSPSIRQLLRAVTTDEGRGVAVGTVVAAIYEGLPAAAVAAIELAADASLFAWGLVEGGDPAGSFCERRLWLSQRVLEVATGVVRFDPRLSDIAVLEAEPQPVSLEAEPETRKRAFDLVRRAADDVSAPCVVAVGLDASGRRTLLTAAIMEVGRPVVRVACRRLPTDPREAAATMRAVCREAALADAAILLEDLDVLTAQPERNQPDRVGLIAGAGLDRYAGLIAATSSELHPFALRRGCAFVTIDPLGEDARRRLWKRALPDARDDVREAAAARYSIGAGLIHRTADRAREVTAAQGASIELDDIHDAMRGIIDNQLTGLGVRINTTQRWDDVVLPVDTFEEIKEIVARIRHKRLVYDAWGFARKLGRGLGLSALFSGAPGTGKTMVAGLIAAELGLDLYQVDLSRIVSKWVGETEKNLASLFAAAESGHAVLLFDEADSLFAKRTDVKSSMDRYANLEVNYLLQRMEAFAGITILTTNHDAAIDDAFRRRLSFRISFPIPDVDERELLWRALLPDEAERAADIDFEQLADRFQLTGGYVRNAVLRAAFFAADEQQPISMAHLVRAAALEVASIGKVVESRMYERR